MSQQSRVVYINGQFVPEEAAVISVRDKGFVYGDGVFDTARTFNGQLFRLEAHVDRLLASLETAMIDSGLSKQEWIDITEEVVARNNPLRREGEDFWVTQRVTAGVMPLDGEASTQQGATVIVDCVPLPLRARAKYFNEGIIAVVPDRKRIAPAALSPNVKSNNYLNMMLAQREAQLITPGAWALMNDENGNIAEGAGCNFFIVKNGEVLTPRTEYVLDGVSRRVVIELCQSADIVVREMDFHLDDALRADEAFFTSTSLCMCPVRYLNNHDFGTIPGPITAQLMEGFKQEVDYDYVAQYLNFLGQAESGTGI